MDATSRVGERLVLLTGASGYVGGRLLKRLERSGRRVRCLARRPEYVRPRAGSGTEAVPGDVLDPASLLAALDGVDTAYYLIHALSEEKDFERMEQEGARRFAEACTARGVRRIIYLGGWATSGLRSRPTSAAAMRSGEFSARRLRR